MDFQILWNRILELGIYIIELERNNCGQHRI
jgi:hypothetical protein